MKKIDKKTDLEIIKGLLNTSRAYFLISLNGERRYTSVGGEEISEGSFDDNIDGLSLLLNAMLDVVIEFIEEGSGNGALLATFISAAVDKIPEVKEIIKYQQKWQH